MSHSVRTLTFYKKGLSNIHHSRRQGQLPGAGMERSCFES